MIKKPKYISFFSGALGLDLGLEKAGFECLAVNEIDKTCCETIKQNRPHIKIYNCDIRSLDSTKILKDLSLKTNELDLIVGGPPCQSWSSAGKMKGLDDSRGNVSLTFIEMIINLKPKNFILENVRGLLTAKITTMTDSLLPYKEFIYLNKPGGVLFLMVKILEKNGYKINFDLYNTAFFNVPQKRERLIIIGSLDSYPKLLNATNSNKKEHKLNPFKTFNDACSKIKTHHHIKFDAHRYEFLKKIPEGGNWKSLSLCDQKKAMGKSFLSGGGKSGFYRRLSRFEPTPTLTTSPRMPATMLCHPIELRPISIEEYSKIQTFPSNYEFKGSITEIYRQIGNAVPVEFGYALGSHLLNHETIDPSKYIKTTKYLNTNYKEFMAFFLKNHNS
jgi:DNA (cytosine-5)-methyltransferase 1